MKLLLDENLSERIVSQISDLFPVSLQVKEAGLFRAEDSVIADWGDAEWFHYRIEGQRLLPTKRRARAACEIYLVAHRQLLHSANRGLTRETAESDSRI